jgi:60 kDa SS-A/Ro ribonucleoprotein
LDDVVRVMQRAGCGGTDCSVPMLHALQRGLEVDAFHVYTDNETWAGHMHPHQALKQYRDRTGIPAKLAVVAFSATDFTIADPSDPGMLDVVGFDTAAPAVIADFVRGGGPPTPTTEEDTEFED